MAKLEQRPSVEASVSITLREAEARADRLAEALEALHTPRPLADWTEEKGDVLWWVFPVAEPPYCGSPLDLGHTVEMHGHAGMIARGAVGGWPGYHTHWTPLPGVAEINEAGLALADAAPKDREPGEADDGGEPLP